jgi:hypothetical protein
MATRTNTCLQGESLMTRRYSPASGGGGPAQAEDLRVELAELGVKVKELHEDLRELVLSFEKLRHRVEAIEHQLANPE